MPDKCVSVDGTTLIYSISENTDNYAHKVILRLITDYFCYTRRYRPAKPIIPMVNSTVLKVHQPSFEGGAMYMI